MNLFDPLTIKLICPRRLLSQQFVTRFVQNYLASIEFHFGV